MRLNSAAGLFFVIFVIFLIVVGPFIGIWVINTLFDLNNPYDLTHWFAVCLSGFAFSHSGGSSS